MLILSSYCSPLRVRIDLAVDVNRPVRYGYVLTCLLTGLWTRDLHVVALPFTSIFLHPRARAHDFFSYFFLPIPVRGGTYGPTISSTSTPGLEPWPPPPYLIALPGSPAGGKKNLPGCCIGCLGQIRLLESNPTLTLTLGGACACGCGCGSLGSRYWGCLFGIDASVWVRGSGLLCRAGSGLLVDGGGGGGGGVIL